LRVPPELVEACQRGDPGAFDELVRGTYRPVYSLVYRIVGNRDDAADVTQDVYVRVWRGIGSFRGEANAATWLHRIAANTALTYVRRRARAGIPTEPAELPEEAEPDRTEAQADADVMARALSRLAPSHRAVVVLKDVYGWSCREIADQMRTTEGAVKVKLFRARQRLADELATAGVVVPMKKKGKRSS